MSDAPKVPYQSSPLRGAPFLIGAIGFFLFLGLVAAVCWLLTDRWSGRPTPARPEAPAQSDPRWTKEAPQLQVQPPAELAQLRESQDQALHRCQWTDASHAFAQIPIEQAMALLSQAAADGRLREVLPPPKPETPQEIHQGQAQGLPPSSGNPPASLP